MRISVIGCGAMFSLPVLMTAMIYPLFCNVNKYSPLASGNRPIYGGARAGVRAKRVFSLCGIFLAFWAFYLVYPIENEIFQQAWLCGNGVRGCLPVELHTNIECFNR